MTKLHLTEKESYKAEVLQLEEKKKRTVKMIQPAFVFITEAAVDVRFSFLPEKTIQKGQLFLLPRNIVCHFISHTTQDILLLYVPDMTGLYLQFFKTLPAKGCYKPEELFFPLEMLPPIRGVVNDIRLYLDMNQAASILMGLKTQELTYFLKHCFSEDNIKLFFSPILTEEYTFALLVMTHYQSVKNAEELAHLSNYTFSGFDKQFRKVFGMAPYRWMLQKKIDKIYHEIWSTSKPVKVIAEECGFTNSSQLGDFCRKHLGGSPAVIRKKRVE